MTDPISDEALAIRLQWASKGYGTNAGAVLAMGARITAAEAECDRLRAALERIDQWAKAYPLEAFPAIDLAAALNAITAAGVNYDALHGTWARHIVEGIGGIASAALAPTERPKEPLTLLSFGYAPGHYMAVCNDCGGHPMGLDKRAWRCLPCAQKRLDAALAGEPS